MRPRKIEKQYARRPRWALVFVLCTGVLVILLIVNLQVKLSVNANSFGFSLDAVDTPQTSISCTRNNSNGPNIWVQLTFSLEFEKDLMPHTLRHYIETLSVDPTHLLVALHHQDQRELVAFETTEEWLRQEYGIEHILRWNGQYTSNRLWKRRAELRELVDMEPCDWIVRSDSDELPAIPGDNLASFLQFVSMQGYDAVFGSFNDRVALDGFLPNISASEPLHEQFPLSCQITNRLAHGLTQKAVAFRAYHQENRGGHSLLETTNHTYEAREGSGTDHCGYPAKLRIDHYKWTSDVIQKLKRRARVYRKKRLHFHESNKLLRHINNHDGRLAIDELSCREISISRESDKMNYKEVYTEGQACRRLEYNCSAIL